MSALAAGAQLAEHCFIYRPLRIDKPLQLKAIVHRYLRFLAVKVGRVGESTYTVVIDASTRRRFKFHDEGLQRGQGSDHKIGVKGFLFGMTPPYDPETIERAVSEVKPRFLELAAQ